MHKQPIISPIEGPYVDCEGKRLLDFSSSDYLGLSQHPDVRKSSIRYTLKYGVGSFPYPLSCQQQLEQKFAHLMGFEQLSFFSSYKELASQLPQDYIADVSLELSAGKKFQTIDDLKAILKKGSFVIAPAHRQDIDALIKLVRSKEGIIFLENTETFGIQGIKGFGAAAHKKEIDGVMGSCVKGGGCPISYVAWNKSFEGLLFQKWSLFPGLLGAIDTVLNLLPDMDPERQTVLKQTAWVAEALSLPAPSLPILTLEFATQQEMQTLFDELLAADILVSKKTPSSIAFLVTALHTPDDLDQLRVAMKSSTKRCDLATQSATPTPSQ